MAGPTATTPALWLKADAGVYSDAGVTPAANAGTVQQWNDQSGNGRHATQATSGSRPTYRTGQRNSLPALDFDGSDDHLLTAYTGEPGCVIAVYRSDTNTAYKTLLGADTSDAVSVGAYYFQPCIGDGTRRADFARCTTSDSGGAADLAAFCQGQRDLWQILSGRLTGSGPYTTKVYKWKTSCGSDTSASSLRPTGGGNSGGAVVGAGYYSNAVADNFDGLLCELLVYSSDLSDAEFEEVADYLAARYDLEPVTPGYVLACFHTDDERLYLYTGTDGAAFKAHPCSYVLPSSTVLRDPSLIYLPGNSTYWLCYTSAIPSGNVFGDSYAFSIAKSTDLVTWSWVRDLDFSAVGGVSANRRCWAPEWFHDSSDDSLHIAFSYGIDSGTTMNGYLTSCSTLNPESGTWGAAAALSGIPSGSGENIDHYLVYSGGVWYDFFKNASTNVVVYKSTTSRTSGYSSLRTGDWAGWGGNVEAPSVLQASGVWRAYVDFYLAGTGLKYSDQTAGDWTGGGSTTWSAMTAITADGLASGVVTRHGTVIRIVPAGPRPPGLVRANLYDPRLYIG